MRNRSSFWSIVSFVAAIMLTPAIALVLAGCGQTVVSTPPAQSQREVTLPPGETLYLLSAANNGASGGRGQRLVAMQPGSAAPAALLTLPAGLLAADHSALYVAAPNGSGGTTIARIDPRTGATVRSVSLPGAYTISGDGWGDATLSPDGQWLALEQATQGDASTKIAQIDTRTMRVARTFTLSGAFTLDAAANGGHMLYLLQTLNDAAHHYYVRAFDAQAGQLVAGYIVDKTALNETWNMAGYAVARQEASDGSVDYTLYVAPGLNLAFVHALPLASEPASAFFAHCINLPVGSSPDTLRYYTLAMSPDGAALYAVNAALGVAAMVSLNGASAGIFSDTVTATAHFATGSVAGGASGGAGTYGQDGMRRAMENGAALSTDGATLYVAGPGGIHIFDARTLAPRGMLLGGQEVTSLAVGVNGKTLYAVSPAAGVSVVDLVSGQTMRTMRAPVSGVWGIVWVQS